MGKNTEIRKIIVFDDKGVSQGKNYVAGIKKVMQRSLPKAKTLSGFSIADELTVEFYYLNEEREKGFSCTLTEEKEMDWYNHLAEIFDDEEAGYLVLCDFGWSKGGFEDANKKIYEHIKQKKNVVFVCYTSVYEHARNWLEEIMGEEHACKTVDILLTMPKDINGKIRSLEEAVLDEW